MDERIPVEKHIGILDGVRAISIFFVVWFHLWQQNWLTPYITFDHSFTRYFGLESIRLDLWVRYGYTFVDMLILLSAFCNFYPYARSILLEEPWPDTMQFYKKRAARILPSYWLAILVMFFGSALPGGNYTDVGFACKDFLAHIFCVSPFWTDTMMWSKINGVFWTVQVEVLYYLLMPWLAKRMKKRPFLTYVALMAISVISIQTIVIRASQPFDYVNFWLTFAGIYANGMLFALVYISLKRSVRENRYTRLFATILVFVCVLAMRLLFDAYGSAENSSIVQLQVRLPQSFLFGGMLLGLSCSFEGVKRFFSARPFRWFCTISYNLYLWHQFLIVRLKAARIPAYTGDTPPNQLGDTVWQWKYTGICLVLITAVAVLLTYWFEIPIRNILLKRKSKT